VAAREALRHLDLNGCNADPLLSKAGLWRNSVLDEDIDISIISQYRFLEFAAEEMDDALLGLHLAEQMDPRNVGLVFYLSSASPTVLEALSNLSKYAKTGNEDILLDLKRHKNEIVLSLRTISGQQEPHRHYSEFVALTMIRALSKATNRDITPTHIKFAHARNSNLREIHRVFRCPVEFMHPEDNWVFSPSVAAFPIVSDDARLLHVLQTHADHLLAERQKVAGLRSMVEHQILSLLSSGGAQVAVVAEKLAMSPRTFARTLAREGLSFSEILDDVRSHLARQYLADEDVSFQQIAWLLGYSEPGAFNHAFRRWFGTSPSGARRRSRPLAN
jgi:AraC-like DNA-binding protein